MNIKLLNFVEFNAQPHTLIMYAAISYYHYTQTAIMKRTSQSENCMDNLRMGLCGNLAKLLLFYLKSEMTVGRRSVDSKTLNAIKSSMFALLCGNDNVSCMLSRCYI